MQRCKKPAKKGCHEYGTKLDLMVRLQFYRFGEYRKRLHWHYSHIHSDYFMGQIHFFKIIRILLDRGQKTKTNKWKCLKNKTEMFDMPLKLTNQSNNFSRKELNFLLNQRNQCFILSNEALYNENGHYKVLSITKLCSMKQYKNMQ